MNNVGIKIIIDAKNCNPNGDPMTGHPRINTDGYGVMTDVCIKRKIRNALQQLGANIFVQSEEFADDDCTSLENRMKSNAAFMAAYKNSRQEARKVACDTWMDIRLFGQVFAVKGDATSLGIRGCVSFEWGVSVLPINITETQITKSVNAAETKGMASDRLGKKFQIDHAVYVVNGWISGKLAEKNGVTEEDYELFKQALVNMMIIDASAARPAGSLAVAEVDWMEESDLKYSPRALYNAVQIKPKTDTPKSYDDYEVTVTEPEGIQIERIKCF